ncbi:right-handed parallel beta-helix repeat-containing protein [Bradyrhizobium tropiciagri]|uniref:right-handed parallel beta-helix repeat-containing protein n=1 Tax=Bradyrhizobium tropiciagri TaxID=312253 RepID=UPI001BA73013|nr:right-handed parallel beta-helix repeat-containing protein [Bradyrhizobium tropiciagri]MBR0875090.1 right-handed parallel beta-helix repeat-containing protein [Bradyrhizobium tropiciagri]
MRRIALLTIAAGLFLPVLASAPAHAQATRTWVSGVGDDANPCSRTAPCKTFAGAISKTAAQGEINCLDPGGFGGLTITKAITVNCHEILGSVLVAGTNGININAGVADRVVLRNLQIQGLGPTGVNAGLVGVKIFQAGSVSIEDCVITQFGQQGILDQRTNAGGKLLVKDTVLSLNGGAGISVAGAATNNATLDNVRSYNNTFGIAVGNGNNVTIKRSDFSSNSTGMTADPGAQISVNSSAINSNATGVNGSGIRVSDSDINFNTTAAFAGTPTSFGTNRLVGNAATGTFNTAAQQ